MFLIRSGIPALDGMFHPGRRELDSTTWDPEQFGIFLPGASRTTSICIAGPDGTGKSVLAMHFASRYLADCHQYCRTAHVREPLAFYVSSDLSFGKAEAMWANFSLATPNRRRVPFKYPQWDRERPPRWLGGRSYDLRHELRLEPYVPEKLEELADYLYASRRQQPQIAFVDLASHTAGDDWGLIERLLAALPDDETSSAEVPRHLLLIDAMEGMETFAGDVDAFGQKTSRRAQVAKLMRLASTRCHLVLIVEEPKEGTRMAEQFVADVVLRLRATEEQGYSRRTIEIEKARGQSHVRGRHPYVVRDGRGSTTGEQVNFDDSRVEEGDRNQSYLDVYPSLHSLSRVIMENRAPGPQQPPNRRAGFGIDELDEMLAKAPALRDGRAHGQDGRGLPCGTVSALIGDANTQKSFLGHAFLGHVFHDLVWPLVSDDIRIDTMSTLAKLHWSDADCSSDGNHVRAHYVKLLCSVTAPSRQKPVPIRQIPTRVRRWAHRIEQVGRGVAGAAVLVTTKDENNRTLVERFCEQLREETTRLARFESRAVISRVTATWKDVAFCQALTAYLESRTICRRLEIHDTPSAVLYHVIRRSVEAAQQIVINDFSDVCLGGPLHADAFRRAQDGWRIRFVLDDFNSVMRTYSRVHDDPMFLPFLLLNLRREGLSALIIETQSGRQGVPAVIVGDDAQSDLRALSDHRLYTWHIPDFFGDHRIAIAAIPPMVQQDRKSPVRVRELEWYEPNSLSPPRVNPRFELYDGLEGNKPTLVPLRVHLYAETSAWEAYVSGLNTLWSRAFVSPKGEGERGAVVTGEKAADYETLWKACSLYANTNIDHSLIVQVDEFWQHRNVFRPQLEYMTRPESFSSEDSESEPLQKLTRQKWFDDVGYGLGRTLETQHRDLMNVDRVPFVWDFGFLVCKERLWEEATQEGAQEGESWRKAADVWKRLKHGSEYSWRDVLEAAVYVAKWEAARQAKPVTAFDLAMMAPQSFSCMLLEIWFSEIYKNDPPTSMKLRSLMQSRQWGERTENLSLCSLLREFEFELYCSWLLLAESLNLGAFHPREDGFGFRSGRNAETSAIVTRHWYKSAALLTSSGETVDPIRFCRLPGAFSVRGDWFLATVRGSRSDRLADRALDLLTSSEANVDRLIHGLGLPTRKLNVRKTSISSRLRGSHHDGSTHGAKSSAKHETLTLTYEDVLSLGVTKKTKHFHWLWRSNLSDYDAAGPIWERWLFRILRRWKSTREYYASDWVNGFTLYDDVKAAYLATDRAKPYAKALKRKISKQVVSIDDFPQQCKKLRDELEQLKR